MAEAAEGVEPKLTAITEDDGELIDENGNDDKSSTGNYESAVEELEELEFSDSSTLVPGNGSGVADVDSLSIVDSSDSDHDNVLFLSDFLRHEVIGMLPTYDPRTVDSFPDRSLSPIIETAAEDWQSLISRLWGAEGMAYRSSTRTKKWWQFWKTARPMQYVTAVDDYVDDEPKGGCGCFGGRCFGRR